VGNAAPAGAQVTIDPNLGTQGQCGYNSDASEVGCDAIHGEKYVAVSSSGPGISTPHTVVVLPAALAYLRQPPG